MSRQTGITHEMEDLFITDLTRYLGSMCMISIYDPAIRKSIAGIARNARCWTRC